VTLDDRIEDHRAMYRADLLIPRLVSRQPPTTLDLNTGQLDQEPADANGMNLSGRMIKRLGHPEGFGADFPWTKALWLTRSWCRRDHRRRYHSADELWQGSLCHRMVYLVVVEGWGVQRAGFKLHYTDPAAILRDAFDFIEDTIDDFRRSQEQRAREDEGRALTCLCGHSWSRHDNPAAMFRCGSCECGRYNADARAA
jgi:hypothetical protein